jgi:hypothetical protein
MPGKSDSLIPKELLDELGLTRPYDPESTAASLSEEAEAAGGEPDGSLPEVNDDNPFQESDEALPDEAEERALDRDPSKEGSRFGEV